MPGFADHHTHVVEQGKLGSLEPSRSGYNPAASEAVRAAILGQHTAQTHGPVARGRMLELAGD